jgi:SAM-dependent methyltransferase
VLIRFRSGGRPHELRGGETFAAAKDKLYRDASESELRRIIRAVEAGGAWRDVVAERFREGNPWLHAIVTHPDRCRFFRLFPPRPGARVLDVGSGWGQIALPLAEGHDVCALEPTPERLEFIRAVARQEGLAERMAFLNADYLQVEFETRFDLIACVGVLEWVGAFSDADDPQLAQLAFLRKLRGDLAEGGGCLIGIENRLGLKYLLGAPDDHIGASGVAVLDAELARTVWRERTGSELRSFTYTAAEYRDLLRQAGFDNVRLFAAYPDYKLASVILSADFPDEVNPYFLEGHYVPEHSGTDGSLLECQAELRSHYQSLARMGIAQFFAPSYFIHAS